MPIPFQSMAERSDLPLCRKLPRHLLPPRPNPWQTSGSCKKERPRMTTVWCRWPGRGARRRWGRGRRGAERL
ncbi:hypothetical protein PVAP13_9KG104900 [Panicum virgatum]|uniref:Uncharacterized protein n=1 Tax=Panicum virgatum TaxID=38727 RepID=A0A8T0NDL9_PANVG|nr:hypothetical protein PVAP13_9KG104900 [Panicum virgatum]